MRAVIVKANYSRDLYVFQRSDGEYGYFELLGGADLELEDILIGNFTELGGETVKNQSTGERVEISIEDYCSFELAYKQVFR